MADEDGADRQSRRSRLIGDADPRDVVGIVLLAIFLLSATAGGLIIAIPVGLFALAGASLVSAVLLALDTEAKVSVVPVEVER